MLKKNKKLIINIAVLGWSFITMIALAQVCNYGITGIDIILPCLFALNVIIFSKTLHIISKDGNNVKNFKVAIPIGFVVDICTVIGNKIDMYARTFDDVGIMDVGYILILFPFFACVIELLFFCADYATEKLIDNGVISVENKFSKKSIVKCILLYAIIMLICWLPFYLTYFPGGVSNDNFECINMIRGSIPWTNHHPVIYTAKMKLFMSVFANVADLNFALGMMVLEQMILMALTLATVLVWLQYHGAGKLWCYISLAFMSLHSAFSMISVCLTKDISFACAVVLLVLFLYEFCSYYKTKSEFNEKINVTQFLTLGILAFLVIITRNNGTMVIAVTFLALLFSMKRIRKHLLITALIVFALNGIYKGPVWKSLGIQKQSFVESASIPLTQIAYTIYTDGVIEGEDRMYLESIMPFETVKKNFIPGFVDSYKFDDEFNTEIVDENPMKLIKVWWNLLPKNFGSYVKAYLFQTCGYWHYGVTNTLCSEGVQPNNLGLKSTDCICESTGFSLSGILPKLMLVVRKLPILCAFTQMAVQLLAVILTAVRFVQRKRAYLIISFVPLLAIWCSIMIAVPAYCLFRYMLPVFFLWPVTIYCFFARD